MRQILVKLENLNKISLPKSQPARYGTHRTPCARRNPFEIVVRHVSHCAGTDFEWLQKYAAIRAMIYSNLKLFT